MAFENTRNATVVIFSKSSAERDYLRTHLAVKGITALFFEKETICFDNLLSIRPNCIILLTDTKRVVWRFIFAIHVLKIDSSICVVSDFLKGEIFNFQLNQDVIRCIPYGRFSAELTSSKNVLGDNIKRNKIPCWRHPLFIGESEKIQAIRSMLSSLETSTDPILITGEPGTGKELLARVVASRLDANCLFIKYNCAALLPKMVSCYRLKGATDRAGEDIGDVNRPRSATILLDRIDRLSKKTQSEMLLLLDDVRKIIPIQFWDDALDIRYIATSEVGLENSLSNGAFRKDLYYRLNVLPIQIPPLRARKEDIPLLADLFSIEACAKTFKSYQVLSTKTKERLRCYEWPNNVQELKRLVQRICLNGNDSDIFSQKGIPDLNTSTPESFFYAIESGMLPDVLEIRNYLSTGDNTSLKSICAKFVTRTEKKLVQKALETTNWNRKRAASLLNISYKSMLNKMKMYEIV